MRARKGSIPMLATTANQDSTNWTVFHLPKNSVETILHAGLENSKLFDMLTTQLAWEMKEHAWWEIIEAYPDFNDWLENGERSGQKDDRSKVTRDSKPHSRRLGSA